MLKEACGLAGKKILATWSVLGFCWAIVAVVFPFRTWWFVYLTMLIAAVLISLIFLIHAFYTLFQTVIDIQPHNKKHFFILRGGYTENMKVVLNDSRFNTFDITFAMGIDASANLSRCTNTGILYNVLRFVKEDYGISQESIQEQIDHAMQKDYPGKKKLDYGDSLDIKIPISSSDGFLTLLLIANSENTSENKPIAGPDSREIILKLFKKCSEDRCKTLFLGAMGTNGLDFPYSIVVAEIINAYAYSLNQNVCPKHVMLSVRDKDIDNQGLSRSSSIMYMRQLLRFTKSMHQ